MNAKCKQLHSLSAGALLLALKPSIQVVYFCLTVLAISPSASAGTLPPFNLFRGNIVLEVQNARIFAECLFRKKGQ